MTNGRYIRRDIRALEQGADDPPWDPYILAYAQAVGVMQGRAVDDPTSWSYQAGMHGAYGSPVDPLWNGCQHGSWFFLPWHRMYILYFEQIVRAIVLESGGPTDWALPYWNYTDGPGGDGVFPGSLASPTLPDGGANPLYVPDGRRAAWVNAGNPVPPTFTSTTRAMQSTSFSPGFGGLPKGPVHFDSPHGLLEAQPHDNMHGALGGTAWQANCGGSWMNDPNCAALDPVFYLHHSNIDRLWERWLAQGGGRANPAHAQWTEQSFSFYDSNGQVQSLTCGGVGDLGALDYAYDDAVQPEGAVEEVEEARPVVAEPVPAAGAGGDLPVRPGDGPEIASGGGAELGGDRTLIPIEATPGAVSVTEAAEAGAAGGGPRVYLHVEGVETDAAPGIVWEVRLDPDGEGGDPAQAVGVMSFFGRGHAHAAEPSDEAPAVHGARFIFDVTEVVRELEAAGRWDESRIVVSFHPAVPQGYDEELPSVRVGRVYVTRG